MNKQCDCGGDYTPSVVNIGYLVCGRCLHTIQGEEVVKMKRTEQPNVTTWADAFGTWHARVAYDRNPMGAAQVAIWREIEARQGRPAPIPHVEEIEPGHFMEVEPPADKPRLSALMAEPSVFEVTQ